MKKTLISTVAIFMLISAPSHAFDWGLGSKIVNSIKNSFSRASAEDTTTVHNADYYRTKDAETISQFLEKARLSGYVTKTGDIDYFIKMGVFSTPGLVIDGALISSGRVLSEEQILEVLKKKIRI